jgi:hypothetical protein
MKRSTTGRAAPGEPNLQNIPVRTAAGRRIRAAFTQQERQAAADQNAAPRKPDTIWHNGVGFPRWYARELDRRGLLPKHLKEKL